MAKALPLVAYSDLESQLEALERDGYAYFPSVINAEEIAELKAVMDRLEAFEESFDRHSFPQNGSGFLNKIINKWGKKVSQEMGCKKTSQNYLK